ncbi:hypothetical protein L249_7862 [Ophiocordyceps polyrhachis-furcata BCC 54312]|uniref:Heat-labile enterotoxin n=1 Tax=Ophiocordyceps polyrhachis-furcata BCC 54312 TaxID=1330021 RepID=A0A367L0V5_9HYPO|nr:hypothetical protein L249_7862 [Ophiocordyceps polyrhachis-furcata BCC 54312]
MAPLPSSTLGANSVFLPRAKSAHRFGITLLTKGSFWDRSLNARRHLHNEDESIHLYGLMAGINRPLSSARFIHLEFVTLSNRTPKMLIKWATTLTLSALLWLQWSGITDAGNCIGRLCGLNPQDALIRKGINPIALRHRVGTVYRVDQRKPAEIKALGGFRPRELDVNKASFSVWQHAEVSRKASGSIYVSTSERPAGAEVFAVNRPLSVARKHYKACYLWEIQATPNFIDVTATIGRDRLHVWEREILAAGGIRWDQVRGYTYLPDGRNTPIRKRVYVPNPDYNPMYDQFSYSGAQVDLAAVPANPKKDWYIDPNPERTRKAGLEFLDKSGRAVGLSSKQSIFSSAPAAPAGPAAPAAPAARADGPSRVVRRFPTKADDLLKNAAARGKSAYYKVAGRGNGNGQRPMTPVGAQPASSSSRGASIGKGVQRVQGKVNLMLVTLEAGRVFMSIKDFVRELGWGTYLKCTFQFNCPQTMRDYLRKLQEEQELAQREEADVRHRVWLNAHKFSAPRERHSMEYLLQRTRKLGLGPEHMPCNATARSCYHGYLPSETVELLETCLHGDQTVWLGWGCAFCDGSAEQPCASAEQREQAMTSATNLKATNLPLFDDIKCFKDDDLIDCAGGLTATEYYTAERNCLTSDNGDWHPEGAACLTRAAGASDEADNPLLPRYDFDFCTFGWDEKEAKCAELLPGADADEDEGESGMPPPPKKGPVPHPDDKVGQFMFAWTNDGCGTDTQSTCQKSPEELFTVFEPCSQQDFRWTCCGCVQGTTPPEEPSNDTEKGIPSDERWRLFFDPSSGNLEIRPISASEQPTPKPTTATATATGPTPRPHGKVGQFMSEWTEAGCGTDTQTRCQKRSEELMSAFDSCGQPGFRWTCCGCVPDPHFKQTSSE